MMIFIGLMVVGPSCSESETEDSTSNASAEKAEATVETPESNKLVIYSGRSEKLVGPVIEQFAQTSGIDVEVKYGKTAEIAATIMEEGSNSPADVFFAQDPGGLGVIEANDMFIALPDTITLLVPDNR